MSDPRYIEAGQEWLAANVYHPDPEVTLTGESVRAAIDLLYDGGWQAFCDEAAREEER